MYLDGVQCAILLVGDAGGMEEGCRKGVKGSRNGRGANEGGEEWPGEMKKEGRCENVRKTGVYNRRWDCEHEKDKDGKEGGE